MNILVTDFDDSGENVMIFTDKLTPDEVIKKLNDKGKSFTDCCQVENSGLQYYVFEPCWI